MTDIQVTIREAESGALVRQFSTNSARFADEETARWQAKYARLMPGTELSVERCGDEAEER